MNLNEKEMCNMSDNVLLILQKDVADIKSALLGNEYNPTSGILPRLTCAEKDVEKVENGLREVKDKINKIIWFAGGIGATAGFVVELVMRWIE